MIAEDEVSGISPDCSEGVAVRLAISKFTYSASLQPAIRSSVDRGVEGWMTSRDRGREAVGWQSSGRDWLRYHIICRDSRR